MNSVINFHQVSFGYGNIPLIKNASFSIQPNEFVTVVGPNGSGKTTLLKLMLGVEKPQSGTITILGDSPKKMRRLVGLVPQSIIFDPLFPASVKEIVLMGSLGSNGNHFFYNKNDHTNAISCLQKVDMDQFQHKSFSELSGGQKQRVLIARALMSNPKILVLDEPTASIDAMIEGRLYTLLKDLSSIMSIVMVSHDHRFAADIVNKVVCLDHGNVAIHCTKPIGDKMAKQMELENLSVIMHNYCRHEGDEPKGEDDGNNN